MTKLTQEQLNEILDLHELWIKDNTKGKQADLSGHDLSELDFYNRDLTKANCLGTNFYGADFENANFYMVNCTGANLQWSIFQNANCQGAIFENANCKGAIFQNANCQEANFENASCQGARFTEANCCGVDFEGANCGCVNFSQTLCKRADFTDTNVSCIIGKVIASTQGLQGDYGRQITLLAEGEEKDWIIFCGCFTGNRENLDDWLQTDNRTGYELESTLIAVDYLFNICRMQHKYNQDND